jgi:hypothetical protein
VEAAEAEAEAEAAEAVWCIWILWEDPDRKKVKDSGKSKRAEPPLWSQ